MLLVAWSVNIYILRRNLLMGVQYFYSRPRSVNKIYCWPLTLVVLPCFFYFPSLLPSLIHPWGCIYLSHTLSAGILSTPGDEGKYFFSSCLSPPVRRVVSVCCFSQHAYGSHSHAKVPCRPHNLIYICSLEIVSYFIFLCCTLLSVDFSRPSSSHSQLSINPLHRAYFLHCLLCYQT